MHRNPDHAVSAIVPVRNEESTIARAVRSLAEQPEIAEILVVNDGSIDGTVERIERLASAEPKLRLLDAGSLPPGWIGKNWAAWQGARHARSRWLLFTDADVIHAPGSAGRALADAEASAVTMLSYSPQQEMHTWWERALIPFVYCRLSRLYPYQEINDPHSAAAAANGQYLLIRGDAYRRIGGHAAVCGEVLEDVALARRAKAAGMALRFVPGEQVARTRMYASFGAMWEGWTKNLFPLVTIPGGTVTRELLSSLPCVGLPCLALAPVHLGFGVLGGVLLVGGHACYALMLRRNRFPHSNVVYYTVAAPLYGVALLVSRWRYSRGKVKWRGRQYPKATACGNTGKLPAQDGTSGEWSI
jgi:cellulose synthase/poly-beta-1,6-N-acetylglucosamine synthase-like glycosyltransferase